MDHLLYIAMSGAKESMNSLAVRSNNLANANTTGFKSDFEQARSMQAFGEGLPTRCSPWRSGQARTCSMAC